MKTLAELIAGHWQTKGAKRTPSGWITGNAPCCAHRGESPDTRSRGGLMLSANGAVTFNCFNCKFHTHWKPGRMVSDKMKEFLRWLGVSQEEIQKVSFRIWLEKDQKVEEEEYEHNWWPSFTEAKLPNGAKPFSWWAENMPNNRNFQEVFAYLIERDSRLIDRFEFYFSDQDNPKTRRSVIIPFRYQDQIVGWTARKIDPVKQRYDGDTPKNYLFNADLLNNDRDFIILVEGIFDAINLSALGALGSTLTKEQIHWINDAEKPVIVVPDHNRPGRGLVDIALDQQWSVSIPKTTGPDKIWDADIDDPSASVERYGLIYTMQTILKSATNNKTEIELLKRFYLK